MSSPFDDLASIFVGVLGDSDPVSYTKSGGATVSVIGIFENRTEFFDTGQSMTGALHRMPVLSVAEADLPSGYGQGDSVVIKGNTYTVRTPLPDGHGMVDLQLELAD